MSGSLTTVLMAVGCGGVVAMAESVAIPLLRRAAVFDLPTARSSHTVPTPRGGGVPIAVVLVAVALRIGGPTASSLAAAVACFSLIGLAEDLCGLPVGWRMALQTVSSAVVAFGVVSGLRVSVVVFAGLGVAVTVWLTAFVNAFNFMDGVNGISGAHAVVGGVVDGCLGWWRSDHFLVAAGMAVAASGLAFLPWNAHRARVFLGDVGSYALGGALGVLAACAVTSGIPVDAALGPLALYLADTAWTLQRRVRAGERWFEPHRTHTYQQWCDLGWSHQRVTTTSAGITALLSLLGVASLTGDVLLRVVADFAGIAVLACYLRSPALLRRHGARAGR